MADIPFVKRKPGETLRRRERQIVCNVYDYIKNNNPQKSVNLIANETAKAGGISV